jgi:hypothetical protein
MEILKNEYIKDKAKIIESGLRVYPPYSHFINHIPKIG